ncbi:MAG TPA: M1 family aminopeptidase [Bryobacteraceae bacterium]|nr:M1 family aminopeptidase [Bryobacteraceae bacterium]
MFRNCRTALWQIAPLVVGLALAASPLAAQQQPERRNRIDVQDYAIKADISPNTQTVTAQATVRFTPVDDGITTASFELNNALNVSRVIDADGKAIDAQRNPSDFSVRLTFNPPLPKGQPYSATFYYDGRLTGDEESPVSGVKFAAIHPDFAYLLYPARWFPVAGYTTDRFAAHLQITVPTGFAVLGSGLASTQPQADKTQFELKFDRHSFPGSIAIVKQAPVNVQSEGVHTAVYFRGDEAAVSQAYGEETGKALTYFTSLYGLAPSADLIMVETEAGAPTGFAAPGMIFFNPSTIGNRVNSRAVANAVARQWWEALVSPITRNHLWIENGMATYSELLWTEHTVGEGAMSTQIRNEMIGALTEDSVPIIQSARLEDFSPELWALTGSKGAVVFQMLRYVMGDDKFFQTLKSFIQQYTWKSANTDEFRKVAEEAAGQDLGYFFIQWIEQSQAPEFKLEYTVFRTQKGFRVMGKIAQDMDTFRMPVVLKINTEGNPEQKKVEVMGTSSEFTVDTFGKPKKIEIDPDNKLLRYDPSIRVAVAIRRGEQFFQLADFSNALREYEKALETNKMSSLANFRIAEVYFNQGSFQEAANKFRSVLDGDLNPKWTEVWARINLGKIYDVSGQRDRAVDQYNQAIRTKDDTAGAQEEAAKYLKTPYQRERRGDDQ